MNIKVIGAIVFVTLPLFLFQNCAQEPVLTESSANSVELAFESRINVLGFMSCRSSRENYEGDYFSFKIASVDGLGGYRYNSDFIEYAEGKGSSFVKSVIKNSEQNNEVTLQMGMYNTPTYAPLTTPFIDVYKFSSEYFLERLWESAGNFTDANLLSGYVQFAEGDFNNIYENLEGVSSGDFSLGLSYKKKDASDEVALKPLDGETPFGKKYSFEKFKPTTDYCNANIADKNCYVRAINKVYESNFDGSYEYPWNKCYKFLIVDDIAKCEGDSSTSSDIVPTAHQELIKDMLPSTSWVWSVDSQFQLRKHRDKNESTDDDNVMGCAVQKPNLTSNNFCTGNGGAFITDFDNNPTTYSVSPNYATICVRD